VISGDGIRADLLEGVTDVRFAVGVLDGGLDVEGRHGRAPGGDAGAASLERARVGRMRGAGRGWIAEAGVGNGRDARTARAAGPGRYPGFTRIETPASGAAHSIGGDCVGERRDAVAGGTPETAARRLRLRHRANAMRAGQSRQAGRHRREVGSMERVTVRRPPCQPNHRQGIGRDLRRNDPFGVRFHTDQLHASRQRSCADRTETTDLADC